MTNRTSSVFPISRDHLQNGLSAREHAAIQLRVPDSGTDWLDALIRLSLRQELPYSPNWRSRNEGTISN